VRALALALSLGFVHVGSNVGGASGGHAALVADGVVYHLQNEAGLVLLVRDGWPAFQAVYQELGNRPLEVAWLDATPETTEAVARAFSRLYVAQEIALARRDAARDDVAWLEAFAAGAPAPPLRGAGLVDPERAGDLDALRLRDAAALTREGAESDSPDVESLRESALVREADRALRGAYGLAPAALAALPPALDAPLTASERAALEALAAELEGTVAALARSGRADRGYAQLLAQARYLAARRSLATNRLAVLDAFSGSAREARADDVPGEVRAKRREAAAALLRRGRALVLGGGAPDETSLNLLEEAAAVAARDGRADVAGRLSAVGLRKLPARARSVVTPRPAGDLALLLARARTRLVEQEDAVAAAWSYELVTRNCITELVRAANGAFGSEDAARAALGAPLPTGAEPFGFVPWVFFDRVRERLRVARVDALPSRRLRELETVARESPGVVTRLRESTAYTSTLYEPKLRDGAFLFFTDDVFWPRPAYGLANFAFAFGYTAAGVAAAPFDRGVHARAGLEGMLWSLPELAFVNVRKGSYDWTN
jgi:hypothetical protein